MLSNAKCTLQLAVVSSYLSMPNNPKSDGSVMTVWLQVRVVDERRLLHAFHDHPAAWLLYLCRGAH